MKKSILIALALVFSAVASAQNEGRVLKGMSIGVGVPIEFRDLKAAGANLHIGYDCAYPIGDNFALGFYVSGGGGFLGAFKPYNEYDKFYSMFKLSAGLLMEIGDLDERPYLVGVGPCTGIGFLDMDMILPIEFRFGRFISKNWYVMGEVVYGYSLAGETASLEPSIRVGYNFGQRRKR